MATLPGLDGRKMSKSYDNTIPLFAPREQLKKLIAGIVTDSRAPGEPKDTEGSALFQIYQAFATPDETADTAPGLCRRHRLGRRQADPVRAHRRRDRPACARPTSRCCATPSGSKPLLQAGAAKARAIATPFTTRLRHAVGLRDLRAQGGDKQAKAAKAALPSFKQYREADGQFYFKFVDAHGRLLLQSAGYASPKDAGQAIRALTQDAGALTQALSAAQLAPAAGISPADAAAALHQLRDAA